jgi:cysteine desulfurase
MITDPKNCSPVYLDHNATSPLATAAREAWLDAHERFWHNPSSPYRPASRARACLEETRATIAQLMDVDDPARLLFVSGATEGNNAVIHYYSRQAGANQGTLLVSSIEHASVTEAIKTHWTGKVEPLPVDKNGNLNLAALRERLANPNQPKPSLVSVMAANNETGVLQPWAECAALCREHRVPFHCDASQWIGRLPPSELGECDWLTASAHKCGGPRGIGLLLRPREHYGFCMIAGGGQENGQRGGTEDLPSILAMLAAIRATPEADVCKELASARDHFEKAVCAIIKGCICLGEATPRLWNTSALILPMREQQHWLHALERHGILASSGSACAGHSIGAGGSHVPIAMGLTTAQARHMLRFSGNSQTTRADWQRAANALIAIFKEWQSAMGLAPNATNLTRVIEIPD